MNSLLDASGNPFLQSAQDKPIVQFLKQQMMIRLVPSITGADGSKSPSVWQPRGNYVCLEHFVLAHGKYYRGVKLGKHYRPGQIKMCYHNSREALIDYEDLTYIEGYVSSVIPIAHAWNSDWNGDVVDTTLREGFSPLAAREYFGIEFDSDYVMENDGALIDNWENDWPLLRDSDLAAAVIIPFEDRR